jgi:glycosyltransferase involved in cell wall biosynthesis
MKSFRYSVIIPALNEEKFLPALLSSLAEQTFREFEVIVVDGGSDDRTVAVARKFARKLPKLSVLSCDPRGLARQRNAGAKAGKGEWFIFSDADNVMLPYALERISSYTRVAKTKFFTTWFRSDSEVTGDAILALFSNMVIEGSVSVKKPFSPGPLTVIRRDVFTSVGGYTEDIVWGEDYEFSKRVHDHGVNLTLLRETCYVWSMRRFRREGNLSVLRKFALAALYNLVSNKALTKMPGYDMGGHLYARIKKTTSQSKIRQFQQKVKDLVKDIFE